MKISLSYIFYLNKSCKNGLSSGAHLEKLTAAEGLFFLLFLKKNSIEDSLRGPPSPHGVEECKRL